MKDQKVYWFPAKRYGWGWGLPRCWQGWVCLALYLAGVSVVIYHVRPAHEPALFMIDVTLLTIVLIVVCWLKGEPPGKGGGG